ncbi:MAG: DNA-3-methyladenine glycosylase [Patescibacteria group bacterium]
MLNQKFFERSAVMVAKDLIGCYLIKRLNDGKIARFMIVETEAYEGLKDKASHASRGETERNKVMFGEAGVWYVYFTYGMHYILNIVCGKVGYPAAVLIRGVVDENGEKILGPARLTKKLKIDKTFNGKTVSKIAGLWIEHPTLKIHDREFVMGRKNGNVLKTPRIGVDYAGLIWSQKLYRFVLEGFETKRFK